MVALRPEPFGALAYHYGNRRLTFVRSPDLVEVVRSLGAHETVDDALSANNVDEKRWRAFHRALDALAGSEVIRRRG
jgi:putative mycofactocin binding protein MftB